MQWHTPESSNFRWTFVRYWDGYVAHSVSLFVTYYDDILVCSVWRQSVSRNFIISFPYCLSWLLHIAWSTYMMAIPLGYVFFLYDLRVMNESLTANQDFVLFISTLSCDVSCDVLITFGMVYTLFSNRTQVRR